MRGKELSSNKNSCCYYCRDKRHVGCHSHCGDYIKERAELDARNEKIKAQKHKESLGIKLKFNK